jgi:hypothetical protein
VVDSAVESCAVAILVDLGVEALGLAGFCSSVCGVDKVTPASTGTVGLVVTCVALE